MLRSPHRFLIFIILLFCMNAMSKASDSKDIIDTAVGAGSFNTLTTALTQAGLIDTLKGDGPFTVFAPTDQAFAALSSDALDALLADKEALINVLTYHVLSGNVVANDVIAAGNSNVTMLNGSQAQMTVSETGVKIDNANVIQTDIIASNGVIHVIDQVIIPSENMSISDNTVNSIVDLAVATPELSTLVSAIISADLVETLNSPGPFTVFAPTNNAFAALPDATLEHLLANPQELAKILTHHVLNGETRAENLMTNGVGSVTTVNESLLYYAATADKVQVGESHVISANIQASNGTIHIIDTVLIPPKDCRTTYDLATRIATIPCVNITGDNSPATFNIQLQETLIHNNFNIIAIEEE